MVSAFPLFAPLIAIYFNFTFQFDFTFQQKRAVQNSREALPRTARDGIAVYLLRGSWREIASPPVVAGEGVSKIGNH